MKALKGTGIWLACGLVPAAILMVGLLPDADAVSRVMMPTFMVTLFLWLLSGLVMVATWQDHRLERQRER